MPIVFNSKSREWVSLESQMTKLSNYNGKTLVPSGAIVEKGELDDGQYPQHCQKWPYNSYVSDAVVKEQIKNDVLWIPGMVYDANNGHGGEATVDFFFPVVGNLLGSLFGRKKRKSKVDDKYNGLEPAGCGPIALLNLFWLYRNYQNIKFVYPGIDTLASYYDYTCSKNTTLEKIMRKIWDDNLVWIKNIDYEGTSSSIKFDSLPLKCMHSFVSKNATREYKAKRIFESVAINKVPVIVDLKTHWALIIGVKFDYKTYVDTNSFDSATSYYFSMGHSSAQTEVKSLGAVSDYDSNYRVNKLYFYAPENVLTCEYVENNPIAITSSERDYVLKRRKEFNDLVGKNYEIVPSAGCKFRKGEVVYIDAQNKLLKGFATVVSNRLKQDDGTFYYNISYLDSDIEEDVKHLEKYPMTREYTMSEKQEIRFLGMQIHYMPESCLQKVLSKTLDFIFFRETNGINANAAVYVNKFDVGQYIYDQPTLISKSNFLGLGDAYISKIYADSSCDIYFPSQKKTFHSAICMGDDYVENYNIPHTASVPAKFEKGEMVYFKDDNAGGIIYKTTISSTEMFVVGLQRTYLVKNAGGTTIQVGESSLFKIVYTDHHSAY